MMSSNKLWILTVAGLAIVAAATAAGYLVGERHALNSLRSTTSQREDLYVAGLESEMRRYEYLPQIVAFDPRIARLLAHHDTESVALVNAHLETVATRAGAAAIYVMDLLGRTLAASNWRQPTSFVDMDFSYRPYFKDAVKGLNGRFYGVGTVSLEPGYYYANSVVDQDRIVGVVAVKINLDKLDRVWPRSTEQIVVVDGNGVVFLSSEPRWKFRTLGKLSRETLGRLDETRQYWQDGSLEPLGVIERKVIDHSTAVVQIGPDSSVEPGIAGRQYLAHGSPVQGTDWQLLVMVDMAPVRQAARLSAVLAALSVVLAGTLALYLRQRRRFVTQTLAARAALQQANDELEQKVQLRTEALTDANQQLQAEVVERKRAESTLRATLHDMVHTAKMAVLGQMSTSITHELNQPLAALQTLSENAVTLLDRSRYDDARNNLRIIASTVARMGQITGQLKKFARRAEVDSGPVKVNAVLADALFLMNQSVLSRRIRLERNFPPEDVWAVCNANRLEQVVVNLISNAADAVEHLQDGLVEVVLRRRGQDVQIEIHDNGEGVQDESMKHLFEPFFTTKAQGVGLGLGLAISNDIVSHFGGTLRPGRSALHGGAVFTIQLKAAVDHDILA